MTLYETLQKATSEEDENYGRFLPHKILDEILRRRDRSLLLRLPFLLARAHALAEPRPD